MNTDQIHVAIPSYKRAGRVKTLSLVPYAKIWVPESQASAYTQEYGEDTVISIPDHLDGSIARKRNAILDLSPSPYTVMMDDDLTCLGYFEANQHFDLSPDQLWTVIEHHFNLAVQLGVRFWGINQNKDPLIHYTYRPFSLLAPILGPFSAHIEPELRYDETMLAKEDYDFWLRNIQKYRTTLRANKYHYLSGHGHNPGGIVSQRTMSYEQEGIKRLVARWGEHMIRPGGSAGGKSAKGDNILNTRIRIPIPGT